VLVNFSSINPKISGDLNHYIIADGSEDLFAHFSAIGMSGFKTLKEGQKVTFEVTQGPKGKQASNIQAA
jgi:cold shock protein